MSDKIMDRVAKLIERASHANTPEPEREACLAKADALMTKFAIDEAMLSARVGDRNAVEREKPETRDIPWIPYDIDFYFEYEAMLGAIAQHCRVRIMFRPSYVEPHSKATAVGFPTDLDYMQLVWNSVYFTFVSKLNPKWEADRTADENIKILKEAGWKWREIAVPANEHDFPCTANDGRLKAAYRRQCKIEGVEPTPHTQRHEAYRAAYAEGFESMISTRLWRMKRAAEKQVADTPGSALALRDRAKDVENVFFEMFPNERPMTDEEHEELRKRAAARRAEEEGRRAKLTDAERAKEDRQRASDRRAAQRRAQREAARTNDDAGRRAGQSAAAAVDLGGTKVSSKQWSKGEIENAFGSSLDLS